MMDFNAFYIEKKMMEKTTGCRVPCKYKVTLKHCTPTVKIFSLLSETNVLMVREAVKVKKSEIIHMILKFFYGFMVELGYFN